MKKLLEAVPYYGILVLLTPVFLFFTYHSFRYSMMYESLEQGVAMVVTTDSWFYHIGSFVLFFLLYRVLKYMISKCGNVEHGMNILVALVMILSFVLCLFWVVAGDFQPAGDSNMLINATREYMNGNHSLLSPAGYLGAYPHQRRMSSLFQVIFVLCGTTNEITVEITNVICVPLIIIFGYWILKILDGCYEIRICYCMLMASCLPLFLYTPYVYGEIISATAGIIFIWASLHWFITEKMRWVIVLAVSTVIGYFARGNFIVLPVAFAVVSLFYIIKRRKWALVISVLVVFLVIPGSDALDRAYYESVSGIPVDQGMPVEGTIAMGLDPYSPVVCGAYTGYNVETYRNRGYNTEAARRQSRQYIKDRVTMFVTGVGRSAGSFYKEKMLAQWNDPTVRCYRENRRLGPEANVLIADIVNGKYAKIRTECLNQYHFLLYFGLLCYLVAGFFKRSPIYKMMIPIILFGGVLFTAIWETKSRYVFPYLIYMIPIVSMGFHRLDCAIMMVYAKIMEIANGEKVKLGKKQKKD